MGTNATQSLGKTAANQIAHNVSFTNDYFMSVFEVTEGQFLTLVTNSSYSIASTMTFTNANDRYMRPYSGRIMFDIRPSIGDFPASGHTITTEKSFMHILRTLVSDDGFDLPTEAFWEYACRAGSTNDLYIGQNYTAARMGMLARWSGNSGSDVTDNTPAAEGGTAIVGSYAPNAWGLYDMYGNYSEMCLDRVCADLSPYSGDDPWGAQESAVYYHRVVRGGAYLSTTSTGLYSSYRTSGNSTGVSGIRLCLTVY